MRINKLIIELLALQQDHRTAEVVIAPIGAEQRIIAVTAEQTICNHDVCGCPTHRIVIHTEVNK